jgi:hypothetical protein
MNGNCKEYGESTKNTLLHYYKKRCKGRNIEFNLNNEYFFALTSEPCFYCGKEPNRVIKSKSGNGDYIYNGIDRLNPKRGYIFGNCITCCAECNTAKMLMSPIDYYEHCKRVVVNLNEVMRMDLSNIV